MVLISLSDDWYDEYDEYYSFEEFMYELEREHALTEWAIDEQLLASEEVDDEQPY